MTKYGIDIINSIPQHQKAAAYLRAAFWLYLWVLLPLTAGAERMEEDTIHNILPDLEVRQPGRSPFRKAEDGAVTIKTGDILRLSRSFGEADLIGKIRSLPLAESTGDYGSGLSVNGADPGQAQYLIEGAPVIFPYRFGGIFSTFNASHFASMDFSRHSGAGLMPRMGAAFLFHPALRFESGIEGSATAGMTASSLTLRAGANRRFAISLSGRISYIDEIYGHWLETSETGIRYGFHDLNADAAFKISRKDIISLSIMHSADRLTYDDSNYSLDTSIKWNNTTYRIGFRHNDDIKVAADIYHSRFADRLGLEMPQMRLESPASLTTSGADLRIGKDKGADYMPEWECGLKLIHDRTCPQWARLEILGTGDPAPRASESFPQKMLTASAYGRAGWWLFRHRIKLTAESGVGWFRSQTKSKDDYWSLIFTPSISLSASPHGTRMTFTASFLNQPMHRIGFSELGLATDFWIGATEEAPMQSAFALSGNVAKRLPWWNLDFEAGAFWNSVRNQTEYQGQLIEIVDTEYSPFSHIVVANGHNYGAYASVGRTFGSITGDINVSYSDGRRHLQDDKASSWAALHSQGLIVKASAIWTDGIHWTLSAAFRLASGRRYTPVEALYMIGGNIAMEYGERNSARLPLYHRLDAGATYSFSTGTKTRLRHTVNLSILNAYGHKNVEMQYFILNSENGDYTLKRLYSLYRFLPSLSYTIEFQ